MNYILLESEILMMQWCIYLYPKDYPRNIVARKWEIQLGKVIATNEVELFDELVSARASMREKGLVKIARNEYDDPVIVETWL